jgi:ligand-binding sensor domain-containing protein
MACTKKYVLIAFLQFYFFLPFHSPAQAPKLKFKHITNEQGLSNTTIEAIFQDKRGFMWFGTQHGLNRYDGYSLRVFANDPRDLNSLSGVAVGALFKDHDGTLWVGCDQFLNRFDRSTEKFTRFPVPLVKHISQDTAGMLWLATPTGLTLPST